MLRNQLSILSVPIDVVTMQQAVERAQSLMAEPGLHMIATANAEMVMLAQKHSGMKRILREADLVVPDGAGVLWAAEQEGKSFPERVAGCDLLVELLRVAAREQIPVYFLGAAEGVADEAVRRVSREVGPLNVVGTHSGFFDRDEEKAIIRQIEDGGAKLVFVALGVPKQEEWIIENLAHLDGVVAMGVGGSFDVLAGNIKRAPLWMQKNRLEWLYRLYLEPSRIIRMLALPKFMLAVKANKK